MNVFRKNSFQMGAVVLVIGIYYSFVQGAPHNNTWSYDDPNKWSLGVPSCKGGRQSPVNINPKSAFVDPNMPALTFSNYDVVFPQTVTNNGRTVMMQLKNNEQNDTFPFISAGGLDNVYIFQQLHFHWGKDDSHGSEHLINNTRAQAELHMVHYNLKYPSFAVAAKHPDGLAVLAILMNRSKFDNVAFRHIEHFERIAHPDGNVTFLTKPISLDDLLPDETDSFYRYSGSLTTPACSEVVTWTVFDTPITLSERQLDMFRNLFDLRGLPLEDNIRPVQSLHDRVVTYRPAVNASGKH